MASPEPTPRQIRAARTLLGWTQTQLAEAARLRLRTVQNVENGVHRPQQRTIDAIRSALESAGIEFLDSGAPGVRYHPARG